MYEKTYLSVSVSRVLQSEYPMGDPFGGPAYGEKAMPFVAVVAAVWGAAALGGAITAIAAATTVAATIGAAFTAIAAIGAITAGVGVITGNQRLVKIGGIMGLVGGVGALAGSVGMFGAMDAPLSSIGSAVDAGEVTGAGITGSEAAGLTTTAPASFPEITGAPINTANDTLNAYSSLDAAGVQPSSIVNPTPAAPAPSSAATPAAPPSAVELVKSAAPGKGVADSATTWFDKFTSFVTNKDNAAIVKIGGDFVGGYFDKNKQAQAGLADAQADLVRQQIENMNRPMPVAIPGNRPNPFAVTGANPVYNAPYVNTKGIINVTGTV